MYLTRSSSPEVERMAVAVTVQPAWEAYWTAQMSTVLRAPIRGPFLPLCCAGNGVFEAREMTKRERRDACSSWNRHYSKDAVFFASDFGHIACADNAATLECAVAVVAPGVR